ncbi:polyadenylation and cleavage factor homolog 4 isoform X1 [Olea europaea subsp. europaea]|nr:polyadenylation and cleavage factor homolog 4 isoform X1 [Olea europaea subsp. europaea]
MRHLFGTWKGVFPPQPLQIIEKELGIATAVNSSSGTTTSRPDSQAQRPAHSIHVNPKYLEARQRIEQSTREIQQPRKDQVNEPASAKNLSTTYGDSDCGSDSSKHSGLGIGRMSEKLKQRGFGKQLYESGSIVTGKILDQQDDFDMKHGFQSYPVHKSTNSDAHIELKHNFGNKISSEMGRSWKNSEEEEYTWDDINSKPTDSGAFDISDKDLWMPDEFERLDFENHIQGPQSVHIFRSRVDDEAPTDSLTINPGQVVPESRMPSSTEEMHSQERRLSGRIRNISDEGYHATFSSSAKSLDRTSFQSQMGSGISGAPSFSFSANAMSGSTPSITQQNLGAGSQSTMHQRPPSPSPSAHNLNQLLQNFADQEQNSTPRLVDPRRPQISGQRNIGPHNRFSQDSLSMPSQDFRLTSSQRLQHQSLQTMSTIMAPRLRNHASSSQQKKLEFSSVETQKRSLPQNSGIENCSTTGKLSQHQPNPLTAGSPGQSITSTLLAAVVKSEISSSVHKLPQSSFQGAEGVSLQLIGQPPLPSGPPPTNLTSLPPLLGSSLVHKFSQGKVQRPPLPSGPLPSSLAGTSSEQTSSVVNPASNPVSSLLSSLVARGLISASKKDSPSLTSSSMQTQPPDLDTGVASSSTTADSSGAVTLDKPLSSTADELSSHGLDAKIFDSPQSMTTKIKNLIGFEFWPDVVRELHPAVVNELLDDLPHQCSTCGLRLKLHEQFDRHMEWHALRAPGQDSSSKASRRWYASSVDWVAGIAPLQPIDGTSDLLGSENSKLLVPADESQCACILCGELFEDFYCLEMGEWMFKGAVYLTNQSTRGRTGNACDSADVSLLIHASCAAADPFCDSGLFGDIKLEKDA